MQHLHGVQYWADLLRAALPKRIRVWAQPESAYEPYYGGDATAVSGCFGMLKWNEPLVDYSSTPAFAVYWTDCYERAARTVAAQIAAHFREPVVVWPRIRIRRDVGCNVVTLVVYFARMEPVTYNAFITHWLAVMRAHPIPGVRWEEDNLRFGPVLAFGQAVMGRFEEFRETEVRGMCNEEAAAQTLASDVQRTLRLIATERKSDGDYVLSLRAGVRYDGHTAEITAYLKSALQTQ